MDPSTLINTYLAYCYTEDVHPTSSDRFIAGTFEHRGYPLSIINGVLIITQLNRRLVLIQCLEPACSR